ncbi:sortase domain-bontaining protein [Luteococcus sp. OSA5]|uniref:sortase domain-containing protein n=1 Tax=Luteococcus sp. OSA5 TaxID=3401630 RepID=UPI003B43AF64
MSWNRRLLAAVTAVVALALALGWWLTSRSGSPQDSTLATPSPGASSTGAASTARPKASPGTTGGAPDDTESPTATASAPPGTAGGSRTPADSGQLPADCSATSSPMVPTRITMGSVTKDSAVLSLGLAADGTVATPPYSQPMSVGWYNLGPKPGAARGKVVLTAHTFREGGGLGNRMHRADGLQPGDIIRLSDGQGRTLCYRHTQQKKVWVKDYDPDSTVLYDAKGKHQLAIVICWDFNREREDWDSRIIYYAEPLAS